MVQPLSSSLYYPASSCNSKALGVHMGDIRLELHADNGIPSVPLGKWHDITFKFVTIPTSVYFLAIQVTSTFRKSVFKYANNDQIKLNVGYVILRGIAFWNNVKSIILECITKACGVSYEPQCTGLDSHCLFATWTPTRMSHMVAIWREPVSRFRPLTCLWTCDQAKEQRAGKTPSIKSELLPSGEGIVVEGCESYLTGGFEKNR